MPMSHLVFEQALYDRPDQGDPELRARSPGFRDAWLPWAEQLCRAWGTRTRGGACPHGVFAQPLERGHVAVVQAADREQGIELYIVVLERADYQGLEGDPFVLAERLPPPWGARGELPLLTWPRERLPGRTVEEVRRVLQGPHGPTLLGAAQALVDGGRVFFVRPGPDTELLRSLWLLLPTSTRWSLWPASFAPGTALDFHVLVVPDATGQDLTGYLTEEQAAEYPEGRYELNLQLAAEAGDQRELDLLFARRSRAETWRLGLALLVASLLLLVLMNWLNAGR